MESNEEEKVEQYELTATSYHWSSTLKISFFVLYMIVQNSVLAKHNYHISMSIYSTASSG